MLAPAATYLDGAVRVVAAAIPDLRQVTVLHGPSGFGRAVGDGAASTACELGLAVQTATLPLPEDPDNPGHGTGGLLLVSGAFAEERAAAAQLLPGPWQGAGLVGAGVDEVLTGLGPGRQGLLGPTQWLASAAPAADEGPSAAEFRTAYHRAAGCEPPYPAAQAFAAGLIAGRCIRDAGTVADTAVRAAAGALDCTTLFGRFRLDPVSGEQIGHRVLTVQWQDGERRVVWPPEHAQSSLRTSAR